MNIKKIKFNAIDLLILLVIVAAIVSGVVASIKDAEPVPLLLNLFSSFAAMLSLYTVAAIVNYLAEITDILNRNVDKEIK